MNWKETATGLQKVIGFDSQTELAQFVLELAVLSDQLNHHADMNIRYNQLELSLFTHDLEQVTDKDWDLAQKIDEIFS